MNKIIENDIPKKLNVTEISEQESSTINNSNDQTKMVEIENSEVSPEGPEADENLTDANEGNNDWLDILGSGGIMKKTIVEGKSGTQPTKNEKCTIKYTCSLENGSIVESTDNFTFFLGESDVISGLDVSIALLNIGEKCLLKIEPRLAYGEKGLPPTIPPNTTVIYEVELVTVEPEDEIDSLTIQQRQITGNKKRERGNWWYTRGENILAIQCYRRALDYLDEVESGGYLDRNSKEEQISDTELQSLLEDRISVYNNMAAAQIKMQMFDAALNSLETVLRCQPGNLKAHFRKAKVYIGKNELHMAMKSLRKAEELAPEDPEIRKEISKILKMMENQKASEKELAKRMFNGLNRGNTNENPSNKNNGSPKKGKMKIWATMVAVVAVGIASIVVHRLKYS